MNELDFSGRQVLVVGGSSGIGNGIAQVFRANGARVQVCGTRAEAADYSPAEGSHLEGLDYAQLDVGDASAIENFKPAFERLDVLVLAQGAVIYRRGEFEMAGFRSVLEINLISLMACATRFHALLRTAKGSLIIVSSTAAYHSTKGNPAYNASKTGAVGLTRTLGQAWAEDGIRVNGIGLVDTKMTKVTTSNPKRLEGAIERIPLKRLGTPADMAGAALFLASPLASYIYCRANPGGRRRPHSLNDPLILRQHVSAGDLIRQLPPEPAPDLAGSPQREPRPPAPPGAVRNSLAA
jgi:3-oxoacyl-[acyl-carrier protein] reductase